MAGAGRAPQQRRYRALVAYEGTDFYGFQRQAGETPTVQGALERALAAVTGRRVAVLGAGRTDSGVHASGQVIAFDAAWRHGAGALQRAVNAHLPPTVALLQLEPTAADFHPRYDARSRTYAYTLYASPVRQPLLERYAWGLRCGGLNVAAMVEAAALLCGTHDFATFGQPPQGTNTVRTVFRSELETVHPLQPQGAVLRYTIEADAFLYRMVRRIVGALARVGRGKLSVEDLAEGLAAADNRWPNRTAPARGLCLIGVRYNE